MRTFHLPFILWHVSIAGMKYVALLTGSGEGCDYTIGCNKRFEVFEAIDDKAALKRCKTLWDDHGGADGDPRVENIELYLVGNVITVPVKRWNDEGEQETVSEANESELRIIEERAKELRAKLGKK